MKTNTKKTVTLAMLAAISVVLATFIRIPYPAAPFLEYDPADVSVIIASLLFGPVSGIIVTIVVSVVQGLTVSASSGLVGIAMHIFATGMYAIITGVFKGNGSFKRTLIAVIFGALSMTIVMVPLNMIFTPLFMGQPFETVQAMILPIIIPFNLIKSVTNGVFALVIYLTVKKSKIL